jgi:hypothetical protein
MVFEPSPHERVWGCWRKKWTKMDVGGGKLVGLVHLQLGEASPHKTMKQGRFTTKNGGKNGEIEVAGRRRTS